MTIAGLERHLPLCKVTDDLYIAGFIMFNSLQRARAFLCAMKWHASPASHTS